MNTAQADIETSVSAEERRVQLLGELQALEVRRAWRRQQRRVVMWQFDFQRDQSS
jgi:hypothetical protein